MDLIIKSWQSILNEWRSSWQNTGILLLFLISLMYTFRAKRKIQVLWIYCIVILLLFFNPLVYWLVVEKIGLNTIFPRMLLCIPIALFIAYMFADYVHSSDITFQRRRLIFCMLLILLGGNCIYTSDQIELSENWYHIPQEAIELVSILQQNEGDLSNITVALPNYPACRFVQLYNATFHMPYGRRGWGSTGVEANELYQNLAAHSDNYDLILANAYICNCNYLVVYKDVPSDGFVVRGCTIIGETDNYLLYNIKGFFVDSPQIEAKKQNYLNTWDAIDWRTENEL